MGRPQKGKSLRIDFTIPDDCPAAKALQALEYVEFKSASQIVRAAVMVIYGEAPGLVGKESQRLEKLFERLIQALEQRPIVGAAGVAPELEKLFERLIQALEQRPIVGAAGVAPELEPPKPEEQNTVPDPRDALRRARRR